MKITKQRLYKDAYQEAVALLVMNGVFNSTPYAQQIIFKTVKERYEEKYLSVTYEKPEPMEKTHKRKNTTERQGYLNRHTKPLPTEEYLITIITKDVDGEHINLCYWMPYEKNKYRENDQPVEGYLGTATIIDGRFKGIGFHAWQQNNSEFIYYKLEQKMTKSLTCESCAIKETCLSKGKISDVSDCHKTKITKEAIMQQKNMRLTKPQNSDCL